MTDAKEFFLSYSFLYYVLFFVAMFAAVGGAKLYDTSTPPKRLATGTISPFPNALPAFAPPQASPQSTACFQLCPDQYGNMEPCDNVVIRACDNDFDCTLCDAPSNLAVSCQYPSSTVADRQKVLGNVSEKYCLMTKQKCVPTKCVEDEGLDECKPCVQVHGSEDCLHACKSDDDCAVCDDLDGSDVFKDRTMTCEYVKSGDTLSTVTKDGQGAKSFTVSYSGSYCLPKLKQCNYDTGSAKWSDKGWVCDCDKFKTVYGGETCDQFIACNNEALFGWSKDKQMLLLNVDAERGDKKKGEVWDPDTGIAPEACHDKTGAPVDCGTADAKPNTFCQCDGVAAGSRRQYRHSANDPLTCELDPCHENSEGGKTAYATHTFSCTPVQFGGHPVSLATEASPHKEYATLWTTNAPEPKYDMMWLYIESAQRVLIFQKTGARWVMYGAVSSNITIKNADGNNDEDPPPPAKVLSIGVAPVNDPNAGNQRFALSALKVDGGGATTGFTLLDLETKSFVVFGTDGAATTVGTTPTDNFTQGKAVQVDTLVAPRQEETTCICSGRGSKVWEYDPTSVTKDNGFTWRGRCDAYTIPGSDITLPSSYWEGCNDGANNSPETSRLVPGKYQDLNHGQQQYDICAADPCLGNYQDPKYDVQNAVGMFNPSSGYCGCDPEDPDTEWGSVHMPDSCDRLSNPVCSYCKNACQESVDAGRNPCPPFYSDKDHCQTRCLTTTEGEPQCDCGKTVDGKDCLFYDDQYCIVGVGDKQCCKQYSNNHNVCAGKGYSCETLVRNKYEGVYPEAWCEASGMERSCYNHGGYNPSIGGGHHTCDEGQLLPVCTDAPFVGACPMACD
jgi:hypothetical protein